jgi:hypothetical protein
VLEYEKIFWKSRIGWKRNSESVVVVLATDGIPTNQMGNRHTTRDNFVEALKSLNSLPVWIVVRLCTQAEDVVKFYETLNEQMDFALRCSITIFLKLKISTDIITG